MRRLPLPYWFWTQHHPRLMRLFTKHIKLFYSSRFLKCYVVHKGMLYMPFFVRPGMHNTRIGEYIWTRKPYRKPLPKHLRR